jgi:hypothetical protein
MVWHKRRAEDEAMRWTLLRTAQFGAVGNRLLHKAACSPGALLSGTGTSAAA